MMNNVISGKFVFDSQELVSGPSWCMTLIGAGSMRFRWNETNDNRNSFLKSIAGTKSIAQLELIHSKIVYDVEDASELDHKQGDGIITRNRNLLPVVTVADCMPVFVYDTKSSAFGVLHSGWKGTGISQVCIEHLMEKYGSSPSDICVVIGPHIEKCCYNIQKERADYFSENFTPDCVQKIGDNEYSLSLTKANLAVLERCAIPENNILVVDECTCCHKENGNFKYGSFRRQTLPLPDSMSLEEKSKLFTVQAAFIV